MNASSGLQEKDVSASEGKIYSSAIAPKGRGVVSRYTITTIVAPSGERLPLLIERDTGVPCEVALRWTVLERRGRVATSTLADDLRAVQRLYSWADLTLDVPLDTHLTEWRGFSTKQMYSLAQHVKTSGKHVVSGSIGPTDAALTPGAFNKYWHKLETFLCWAAEMYARDEWGRRGQYQSAGRAREHLARSFRQHHVREALVMPARTLTDEEWRRIQRVVRLGDEHDREEDHEEVWPDPVVRLRNHTMVYLAINTGIRVGEMLKLTLDQIPRGSEDYIVIKRRPDDPFDPRIDEPQVKTNERELYVLPYVRSCIGSYVTRYRPRTRSPYVFLAQGGQPLSLRGARHVVERVSQVTGVPLTWHRFRQTFLNRVYEHVADRDNGLDLLAEIAGWSSPSSSRPYVRMAIRRAASKVLVDYQSNLFTPQ